MPLFEYECRQCSERVELIQNFSDAPPTHCTKCGGEMKKLFSSPAIQFKGSGFYKTDYGAKSESKSDSKSESKSESASDSKSESKSESKSDSKSESKSESKSDSKSASKSEAAAGTKASSETSSSAKKSD